MKVLMLIISSNTDPIYNLHKDLWRSYMKLNEQIECYFIQYRDGPQELIEDTLWLSGKESFETIIHKTIDSLEYFLNLKEYDFIVRTNLSSVWNFEVLLTYLKTLPTNGVYSGIIGKYCDITYVSGSGFIMTPDVCNLLIKNKDEVFSVKIIDDVDIGLILLKNNVKITAGKRLDGTHYSNEHYHYRCKQRGNPIQEVSSMKKLIRDIYKDDIAS